VLLRASLSLPFNGDLIGFQCTLAILNQIVVLGSVRAAFDGREVALADGDCASFN
jgi:hypothetical protein